LPGQTSYSYRKTNLISTWRILYNSVTMAKMTATRDDDLDNGRRDDLDDAAWTMRTDSTPVFTKTSSRQYSGIYKNK
jgi:hypothetical protein